MNKKFKITISIIASMIIIMGSAFTIYAATTEYSLKSHGIIAHDGDGDGAYTNTAKDIYIDSGDLKTINDAVVAGKTSLASAINSATASSATNKTTLGTTEANLPEFKQLKDAIAKVKAAGNEEGYATGNAAGIITGQNNVINNVGGKTSATLEPDGSLKLGYDGTTGTSSVGNPTWAAIENKLSGKTDADGNPIYSGITDLDSLENAITADNDNSFKGFSIPILEFSFGNNSAEFYGGLGGTITFNTAEYTTVSISTVETSYGAANNPGHGITPNFSSAPKLHICSGETDISTLINGNKNILLDISGYDSITMEVQSGLCASGTVHLTEVTFK